MEMERGEEAGKRKRGRPRKRPSRCSACPSGQFVPGANTLVAAIRGGPVPLKRPGFGLGHRRAYNSNHGGQCDSTEALEKAARENAAQLPAFGPRELEIPLAFDLKKPAAGVPDAGNLAKFVMGSLEKAGIFSSGCQAAKLVAEKRRGQAGMATAKVGARATEL